MTDTSTTEIRGEIFEGQVDVDDRHFIDCTFGEVQLRYGGGQLPRFEGCNFTAANWFFHGAALRTIRLLQMQNAQGENQGLIDQIFRPGTVFDEE